LAEGVGIGRRNWLALESTEDREGDDCKDNGEVGVMSCVDTGDVGESVTFCEADAIGIEGPAPFS
jgi:hypothetical protein